MSSSSSRSWGVSFMSDEREGAIAHHPLPVAGSVAGVAQVKLFDPQRVSTTGAQQAADAGGAACVTVADLVRSPGDDRGGGATVEHDGVGVPVVMREVAADNYHRLGTTPDRIEHGGNVGRRATTHRERQDLEVVDHHLQERKLDLEAVLVRVGLVIDAHAQLGERELTCRRIDRNEPERRSESIRHC